MNLPEKKLGPAPVDVSTIPGWGVDADPANDPTYPMRNRTNDVGDDAAWQRPTLQDVQVPILQSNEYLRRPAVVGSSTPPSRLSGTIRAAAFRWSESNWLHWLLLLGADRVNVIEGVIDDLSHARLPNIPAEMGIKSELRFNKLGFAKKAAIGAGLAGLAIALRARKRSRRLTRT